MRIVALVPGGIGDQILLFPTLDDLKRSLPSAQIDVVTEPRSKAAYRVSKSVHQLLTFDFQDRNSLADWGNLVGMIRDREYDVAIYLGQSWLVSCLLWLTGIPTRIGYQGKGSAFFTNPVPFKQSQYIAAMYHDLLTGLGIQSTCPDLTVNIPLADIDWAEKEQKRLGVHETGYILISAGSSQLDQSLGANIYPVENWRQIIQNFRSKQPEMPVVLVKQAEDELVTSLESSLDVKITSPDDIGKLAAMIGGANLMLCTDSTPMHLSVAVQTYTIALFGDTEPAKLLPKSDKFLAIKSPTGRIADISPNTVLQKVWGG
ncbi:glycosyltransferase family 9 protein [Plectonema radiosum NIES-515]|uniref:Glycosyltransferase family 9 protein n=1 Tax=Plectonema radiosum NIES-515 TaxID=2986073 RepID=A0ABT3AUC3_9CYAN|nr:glycosyltransferase family 9 protein [Plectonema radiosum]MCV3212340.1 glycosyltransferase family 9 protein [Plectonema radiosum NIES-515]